MWMRYCWKTLHKNNWSSEWPVHTDWCSKANFDSRCRCNSRVKQCYHFSRYIGQVTPKSSFFYYYKKTIFWVKISQTCFNLISKTNHCCEGMCLTCRTTTNRFASTWDAEMSVYMATWGCRQAVGGAIEFLKKNSRYLQTTPRPQLKKYAYILSAVQARANYRIAAMYSNKDVFQHWFKKRCRITSWKDLMPQCAHHQGASNATFGSRIWHHLAKLNGCEVRKAFEYFEVI